MIILVTGANGQLGSEMRLLAASRHSGPGPEMEFLFTDVTEASEESATMLRKLAGIQPATEASQQEFYRKMIERKRPL